MGECWSLRPAVALGQRDDVDIGEIEARNARGALRFANDLRMQYSLLQRTMNNIGNRHCAAVAMCLASMPRVASPASRARWSGMAIDQRASQLAFTASAPSHHQCKALSPDGYDLLAIVHGCVASRGKGERGDAGASIREAGGLDTACHSCPPRLAWDVECSSLTPRSDIDVTGQAA